MTAPSTDTAEPATHRVLIAEDEPLIRLDLAEMLRDEGYEVVGRPATARRPSIWPRSSARTW